MKWKLWLLASLLLLAGCSTTGRATDGCAWARPILPSRQDRLTDGTASQILIHNETGQRICGWKREAPSRPPAT
jgi:uncharacterized lipoprotein YajG